MNGYRAVCMVATTRTGRSKMAETASRNGCDAKLHLAKLVDHHDLAVGGLSQRGDGQPLECGEVDAVAPDAGWAWQVDVGEHSALASEALDGEADAPAALADLLRDEPGHWNAHFGERVGQASRDRALA